MKGIFTAVIISIIMLAAPVQAEEDNPHHYFVIDYEYLVTGNYHHNVNKPFKSGTRFLLGYSYRFTDISLSICSGYLGIYGDVSELSEPENLSDRIFSALPILIGFRYTYHDLEYAHPYAEATGGILWYGGGWYGKVRGDFGGRIGVEIPLGKKTMLDIAFAFNLIMDDGNNFIGLSQEGLYNGICIGFRL